MLQIFLFASSENFILS